MRTIELIVFQSSSIVALLTMLSMLSLSLFLLQLFRHTHTHSQYIAHPCTCSIVFEWVHFFSILFGALISILLPEEAQRNQIGASFLNDKPIQFITIKAIIHKFN